MDFTRCIQTTWKELLDIHVLICCLSIAHPRQLLILRRQSPNLSFSKVLASLNAGQYKPLQPMSPNSNQDLPLHTQRVISACVEGLLLKIHHYSDIFHAVFLHSHFTLASSFSDRSHCVVTTQFPLSIQHQ